MINISFFKLEENVSIQIFKLKKIESSTRKTVTFNTQKGLINIFLKKREGKI